MSFTDYFTRRTEFDIFPLEEADLLAAAALPFFVERPGRDLVFQFLDHDVPPWCLNAEFRTARQAARCRSPATKGSLPSRTVGAAAVAIGNVEREAFSDRVRAHDRNAPRRIRDRNTAQNFALLRRVALSLLKNHTGEGSIATKRLAAALDEQFLEEVIRGALLGKL